MHWSLFLLILMGQCSLFVCHLYEYHFIQEIKTWKEAQAYCKAHYTDLAKVFNIIDMNRLLKSDAWIGLHSSTDKTWHWSLPGVEYNESKWAKGEPNNKKPPENCVWIESLWKDAPCNCQRAFICYDAKQVTRKFHLIKERMTWPKAQNYCREHHTDLVSGLKQLEDAHNMTKFNSTDMLWIGLFRDHWKWSDGTNFSFRNWDLNIIIDEDNESCAMTASNRKWSSDDCSKTKSFFCYDDKVILIKELKTWDDALDYCRHNYHDLVSITNRHQQRWVQKRAKMANTAHVWLGLRYTCAMDLWFWVNDKVVCYKNWASEGKADDECDMAAAMDKNGKWSKVRDTNMFNFICALK